MSSNSNFDSAASQPDDQQLNRLVRRNLTQTRYKEKAIKFPPIPEQGRYRAWLNTIYQNIAAASGRPVSKACKRAAMARRDDVDVAELHRIAKKFTESSFLIELTHGLDQTLLAHVISHRGGFSLTKLLKKSVPKGLER